MGLNHGWSYVVTTVGCGHAKIFFDLMIEWILFLGYRFIINISIGEDFLFYNSDSYKVTLKTFHTYKQLLLQLQLEYIYIYKKNNSHVDISGTYLLLLLYES